jgi:phosphoribosylamine--glycine ligase
VSGDLRGSELRASEGAAVTVVLAAASYPEGRDVGSAIEGVEDAERLGAHVFHAGTAVRDGRLVTNGGRILSVTATGETLPDARAAAYAAVERISFPGARYRRDVAAERGQRVGG